MKADELEMLGRGNLEVTPRRGRNEYTFSSIPSRIGYSTAALAIGQMISILVLLSRLLDADLVRYGSWSSSAKRSTEKGI